ncbi:elongation factor P [Blochmannia endosymbiont of Polyrhachis (Hedomyrma) turneri]|uniref:elongation factor P n=1 Tax=Blochmannia endosymbiont of Polyrhachis (Hedomyrma) turneri TaxID=1505596 RepID=UPI00061A70E7|nr:elongation factor P [Blochmannia endosymbiont of Polyrhachis (Hedomyrma) turneri]AKC59660.1 Elongation factor P [Blochmannia endosymbiont of Polyrhachis (Hedomyrma) turneri]
MIIRLNDINKFCVGLKIMQDGEPCIVISNEFVKPGKGQSFSRVRFRKLITGKILEKTFKSGDSVELANVEELCLIYLYNDRIFWYFMNNFTFEQISLAAEIVRNNVKWLIAQSCYEITFWNDNPIFITPPKFVNLEVVDIQPAIKGDTVSASTKLAILSTDVVIKVPLFIEKGDLIKVDTRSSEYVARISREGI